MAKCVDCGNDRNRDYDSLLCDECQKMADLVRERRKLCMCVCEGLIDEEIIHMRRVWDANSEYEGLRQAVVEAAKECFRTGCKNNQVTALYVAVGALMAFESKTGGEK